MFNSST